MTDYQKSRAGEWFVEANRERTAVMLTRSQVTLQDSWVGPQALYVVQDDAEQIAYAAAAPARSAYCRSRALRGAAAGIAAIALCALAFALLDPDDAEPLVWGAPVLVVAAFMLGWTSARAPRPEIPGVRLRGVDPDDLHEVLTDITRREAGHVLRAAGEPAVVQEQVGAMVLDAVRERRRQRLKARQATAWARAQEIAARD